METFDISNIVGELVQGSVNEAKAAGVSFLKEVAADAAAFVQSAIPLLSRYIDLVITNQISLDEFKSLLLGLRDLAELKGLTAAGLAQIELEATRDALLRGVTSVALGVAEKFTFKP